MKTAKTKQSNTIKAIIYGVQGVGKSTFMAKAPKPLFLDFEDSTSDLDVRVDVLDPAPCDWESTLAALDQIATEKHDFKSVCIDSLDWLENVCIAHVCKVHKVKSIVDPKVFGYGRGHVCLFEEWRELIEKFKKISAAGINVLCSAHSAVRTYNDPLGAAYDRYSLKLTQNKQCDIAGYTQEWAQCVMFAHYDTVVGKVDERNVGLRGTSRVLHTERADAYDAKNRWGLPAKIALDWDTFAAAVVAGTPEDPEIVKKRIFESGVMPDKVVGYVEHCNGDSRKLSQLENWLKTKREEKTDVANS